MNTATTNRTLDFSHQREAEETVAARDHAEEFLVSRRELFPPSILLFCLTTALGPYILLWLVRAVGDGSWAIVGLNGQWSPALYWACLSVAPLTFFGLLVPIYFSRRGIRISRRDGHVVHHGKTYPLAQLSLPRIGTYATQTTPERTGMRWYFIGINTRGGGEIKLYETTRNTPSHARLEQITAELNEAIFWQQRFEAAEAYLRGRGDEDGSPYRASGSAEAP